MGPLSVEEVLAEEAIALGGATSGFRGGELRARAANQGGLSQRIRRDGDVRGDSDENSEKVKKRKDLHRSLDKLNRAAHPLSGGGMPIYVAAANSSFPGWLGIWRV
jgi:hypothetical protein